MKIGILTFHCAHNYGAVLQAYGLQEYLKSCGQEVEIIDYRPAYLRRVYRTFPLPNLHGMSFLLKATRLGKWILTLPKRILDFPVRWRRYRHFEMFIQGNLNISQERFEDNGLALSDKYDAIVVGSDQIWNPNLTAGGDPIFLGNFPTWLKTFKITYAASAGALSETLGENPVFTNALKNFNAISVREDNLRESLQPHTNLKIDTVLDPTLLVDKSIWEKILVLPQVPRKYVLIYQISYNPEVERIAKEIATQINADVVEIGTENRIRQWDVSQKSTETVGHFLGWFKNAACVVTSSFHGTAFGIIFEKPFYYVGNGSASENRPKQILNALGLKNRYVKGVSPAPEFEEIDYRDVSCEKRLEELRTFSQKYLQVSLKMHVE